jgi:hypothetical protein
MLFDYKIINTKKFYLVLAVSLMMGISLGILCPYLSMSKYDGSAGQLYDNREPLKSNDDDSMGAPKDYPHSSIIASTLMNQPGIWHSAMVDETGHELVNHDAIEKFENDANKKLALVVFSNDWYHGIAFPEYMANIVKDAEAMPIIRIGAWQTNGESLSDAGPYTMSNIVNGLLDQPLRWWADDARSFDSPILVDFGYEPNNNHFPWSKQGPEMYVDAYRHLVTLFREQNATNVYFVYHPDLGSNPDNMKEWYPGDQYIDLILVSAYGEDEGGTLGVLNDSYHKLTSLSLSKPLGIEEWGIGSPEDTKNTLEALHQSKYSRIKILSLWNEGPAGGIDRRINKSPEMLDAYRNGISSPYYLSSF